MLRNNLAALVAASLLGGTMSGQEQAGLEDALQEMLSERESPEKLAKTIADARKLGATEQAILEARFLYHVDRREDDRLAALLPDLEKQAKVFKLSESEIFAVEEDWLAILEYVRAIRALQANDQAAFKEHIKEAFWLSPQQGSAFAPHIERLRLAEAMKKAKVDFSLPFKDLNGIDVQLQRITEGRKALLIHFFSPWSRECEESLPEFAATSKALDKAGIAVVTVIAEAMPEAIADTRVLLETLPDPKGPWLLDHKESPLSRTLRIQSAPTMVLVELDGSVRFNGHPTDRDLWAAVTSIATNFKRPPINEEGH